MAGDLSGPAPMQPGAPSSQLTVGKPFADFNTAAQQVLDTLKDASGMQLWMITRVVGEKQIVLLAQDHDDSAGVDSLNGSMKGSMKGSARSSVEGSGGGFGVVTGQVLPWETSLCQAMVAGQGPHIAPSVAEVPAYAAAPNGREAGVRAYVGVPLRRADGQLLGTLCAFDTRPQPETLRALEPDVHLKARLLATLLVLELEGVEHQRRAERAQIAAGVDALTGLANRRAWDEALKREEARCRRYGQAACVVVVDLDGLKEVNDTRGHLAGDELLRSCAHQLRQHARSGDLIARLGGDEFAVLLVECAGEGGQRELHRLRRGLQSAGIAASAGLGVRRPEGGLVTAWQQADEAMYREKHAQH